MFCLKDKCFGNSAVFKGVYLWAAGAFVLLGAYRAALLMQPVPGIALLLALFILSFALFVLLCRTVKKRGRAANFYALTAGFACTYSLSLYIDAEKSLIWVFAYAACVFLLRSAMEKSSRKEVRVSSVLMGILFALFIFSGAQLEQYGRLEILYLMSEPVKILRLLACLAGQTLFFTVLLNSVFTAILERDFSAGENETPRIRSAAARVALMTVLILLCWLPYFYAFYPGNLSPDSLYELRMQLGLEELSNHHPYAHQLLIALALRLGGSSLELGVAFYSAIQMLALALTFALCVYFLGTMGVNRYIRVVALCFFALFPVNAFYSVTMWKDVFYAAVCLGFMMLLIYGANRTPVSRRGRIIYTAALVLLGFSFCVFRNNGWYAFLLGFPLYILCNRKNWKRLCAVFVAVVLLVSGYNHIIFDVMGIKKSASGESLSVLLQQIARTADQNPEELESEDFVVLREVFPEIESLGEKYVSYISDPVKADGTFLAEEFDKDPVRYLKSWARIGLRHPVTYVEAFLLQNYGYWYPDVTYWIVHNTIEENELGLSQREETFSLQYELSMLTRDLSEKLPTSVLFSLGLMVWLMMIAAALLCLKGQGRIASPIFLMAMLWLTTLASPVYCEYRYLYGFVVSVPLFLGLALGLENKKKSAA